MHRLVLVTTLMILSGCATGRQLLEVDPMVSRLAKPIDELAIALAGEDVSAMRRAGRNVIAIYDAAVGAR